MKVSLVVQNSGKAKGQAIPITLAQFIIGRDPECNLRPGSAVISKRHCAILVKNRQVSVRDFESTNGTFVNDTAVKGEIPLKHDDVLKVGPLTFKVVIEVTAKKTPVPSKPTDDESVAAMLMSLQDEGDASTAAADAGVPLGSTIMDVVPLNVDQKSEEAAPAEKDKKAPKKEDTAHIAAKALLDKYTRRPRG